MILKNFLYVLLMSMIYDTSLISSQETTTEKPKAICPSPEIMSYCECKNDRIECKGNRAYNLSTIFGTISKSTTNPQEKHFSELWISNHGITELEDNMFNGVKFDRIRISDATNLSRISAKAFKGTEDTLSEFVFNSKNQIGKSGNLSELFEAFTSLPNLRTFSLNAFFIDSIADNLFNKQQNKLSDIDFAFNLESRGLIKKLGNKAFYILNNLEQLNIGQQSLDFLPKNAFDFELASNKTLHLYLHMNLLNESSFETGIFENTKRPVYLFLKANKIAYLDQKIFEPFLKYDKNNVINMDDVEVVCDCKMFWLMKNKILYSDRVMSMFCKSSNSYFFDLTAKDFENCQTL